MGVVRGDSQLAFNPYASMQAQITSGQVRMMAVTGLQRSPAIPDVPTFAESGIPDLDILNVVGILAPAGTLKPVVERLNHEIAKILQTSDGRSFVTTRGNDIVEDLSACDRRIWHRKALTITATYRQLFRSAKCNQDRVARQCTSWRSATLR